MSNRLFIFMAMLLGLCIPISAEITTVAEALEIANFLCSLEDNYKDAFKQPNIRFALEELLAFYENSNDFKPEERSGLFSKLHRLFQLVEEIDAQSGLPTKFLNSDQTLVTYWTQVVAANHTILDLNNNAASHALNLVAPPTPGFNYTYTLQMPVYQGLANQVLSTDGNNPAQLSGLPPLRILTQLIYLTPQHNVTSITHLFCVMPVATLQQRTITLANSALVNYNSAGSGSCPGGVAVLSASGASANTITIGNAATTTINPANNLQTSFRFCRG